MGLLVFLIIAGLFLWLICYLFYRTLVWVFEPLVEYMEGREAERFIIEEIDKDEFDDSDIEKIPKKKLNITIKSFDGFVPVPKSILKKAQKEPQKLPGTNLWVYKNEVLSSKPTKENLEKEKSGPG